MAHVRTDPITVLEQSYGAMVGVAAFAGASPEEVESVVRDAAVAASAGAPNDLRRELFRQLTVRVAALERAAGRAVAVRARSGPLAGRLGRPLRRGGLAVGRLLRRDAAVFDELRPGGSKAERAQAVAEKALAELPLGNRIVVVLRDVDGWTAEEVAELLGVDVELQRVALHGGRARIRHALEELASEGDA